MDVGVDYEARRKRNIADNKRILAEIGLINPFKDLPKVNLKVGGVKRHSDGHVKKKAKRPLLEQNVDLENHGSLSGKRRRSARIQGTTPPSKEQLQEQIDLASDDEEGRHIPVEKKRPNMYGAIEGVKVGSTWPTRMECCRDGIHRPTVAGIHRGPEGAYSIALSGGYDDNVDYGECFTYTGEGGRDLKGTKTNPKNLRTAPQSKDQTLTNGNLALSQNVVTKQPVRVIRGYKLPTVFAPAEGYRYDGLYTVQKAWFTTGLSGYGVWKFALRRCEDQSPPPWTYYKENGSDMNAKTQDGNLDNNANQIGADSMETETSMDAVETSDEPVNKGNQANVGADREDASADREDACADSEDASADSEDASADREDVGADSEDASAEEVIDNMSEEKEETSEDTSITTDEADAGSDSEGGKENVEA